MDQTSLLWRGRRRGRAFAAVFVLAAGFAAAQAPTPAPTPPAAPAVPPVDPDLPAQLKELKSLVADPKMQADFQAIARVQALAKQPDQRNPKDAEKIAKAFGDVFRTGKVRPADKDHLYRETGDALAGFGANGAKELVKALDDKRLEDLLELRAHLIRALGRTGDDRQIEWLLDVTLRSPKDELRAAAGEALGNFAAVDLKIRRDVVKRVIREWGSLHQRATTPDAVDPNTPVDFGPQNARKTLKLVEPAWNATLAKLTGATNTQFLEWQHWLNKNPNWTSPEAPRKP